MSSIEVHQQGSSSSSNGVCGSTAPPPTPSQGACSSASSSAILNNDAFSAFFERSLGIANLVLPTKITVQDRDLPVIDLSGERELVVRKIAAAAAELGCFQVVNHGVPSHIVERAEEECKRLFRLPFEKKEEICRSLHSGSPLGFEDDSTACVSQESFCLQKDADQMQAFITNIWPEGCVNFSRAVGEYCVALEKVSGEILDLLLQGLVGEDKWLARSYFTAQVTSENASLVCITKQKVVPIKSEQSPRIKHCHPYILSTRYQSIDSSYAYHLYVDRSWVRVIPHPASLMVTLGDILKVWSNGKYKSVIGSPVGVGGREEEKEKEEEEEEEENILYCTGMALVYSPLRDSTISPIAEVLDSDDKKA
ncbi:hypothetical protein KI387_026646, partial [Taxus chinensis]